MAKVAGKGYFGKGDIIYIMSSLRRDVSKKCGSTCPGWMPASFSKSNLHSAGSVSFSVWVGVCASAPASDTLRQPAAWLSE